MSEISWVDITFDVPYTKKNIEIALTALESAVEDNWGRYADDWSQKNPEHTINIEEWLRDCDLDDLRKEPWREHWTPVCRWTVEYSPVSYFGAFPRPYLHKESGCLGISVSVTARSLVSESRGEREQERMDREYRQATKAQGKKPSPSGPDYDEAPEGWWEKYDALGGLDNVAKINRLCLAHIITVLCAVFPVKSVVLDKSLKGMKEFETQETLI